MPIRKRRAIQRTASLCLTIASLITSGAVAQDISSFTRTTNPLNQSQQETLERFVAGGIRGLSSDSVEAVVAARMRMVEPLTKAGTSPVFRDAFGKMLISELEGIASEQPLPTFNYANIYQVLAFVRTGESNEFLASCLESKVDSQNGLNYNHFIKLQKN